MDDDTILNSDAEPKVEAASLKNFKIKVSRDGIDLGWWTNTGSPEYWITVVEEKDASVWYQVFYNGSTYLSTGSNNYLSYRTRGASGLGMKMRGWTYAAKWQLAGNNLKCVDNDRLVGVDGDYFYVNGENVVDVKYVPV